MPTSPFPACDKQLGPWRLSRHVLGSGTTSTVVRATHAKLPALRAAVKVISRRGLLLKADGDPAALHLADAVIHREVLLMKLAAHERVVRLFDFVASGDNVYIIMEHAPGQTLFDLFRTCPSYLPAPLVTRIFWQVMHGLAALHALHIVHRDLKLENLFVCGPPLAAASDPAAVSVKIGDFGLAHVHDPRALSTVFHGSPHYQAPELWARRPHHAPPTDIWSAGVVLYALQCRRLPFDPAALAAHTHAGAPPAAHTHDHMPHFAPPALPPAAAALLRRLFALDPLARPTAPQVLRDPLFAGLLPPPPPPPVDAPAPADADADLYDLATLCVPAGTPVPRAAFPASALARTVRARLARAAPDVVHRWAHRLAAWRADKDAWHAAVDVARRPRFAFRSLPGAAALQERREALLRRAFELGLGTSEVRVFADEAARIVREARRRECECAATRVGGEGGATRVGGEGGATRVGGERGATRVGGEGGARLVAVRV